MTRWVVALLVVTALGCDRGPNRETQQDEPAAQPDRPLLAATDVSVVERFVLSDDEISGEPRDVAIDGSGNVFVLDFGERTEVHKYDPSGEYQTRLGARDTDQDRVVSAIEIDASPWNTIYVLDRGKNALLTYLTLGTFAASVDIEPGIALDVHAAPEFSEYYLHTWFQNERRSVVLHMREPADSLGVLYEVQIPFGLPVRREARGVHYLTEADARGNLYVAFYDGYPVRVLSPVGETLRLVDLDRESMRKTDAEIEAETRESFERLQAELPGLDPDLLIEASQADSLYPIIEELTVDPLGRLWVRTHRPDSRGDTPYDVFNEAGEYLARVDVPGYVRRTTFAPDGALYVVASAEPGGPDRVVAYDVRFGARASDGR